MVGVEQVLPREIDQYSSRETPTAVAPALGAFIENPHFNPDLPDTAAPALALGQVGGTHESLYLPFNQRAKSLSGQQHPEIVAFATYVVQRAANRHAQGLGGVVLRAQGGGNGGWFSLNPPTG